MSDTTPPNAVRGDLTAPGAPSGHTGTEVPVHLTPRPLITESAVGSPPPPVPAAAGETVTITLDGRELTVPKGQLIIDAADRAGTYIPRFCYHPRMKPVGMCRMCLVEVEGPRGSTLMPACYNPVADGMKISTTSPMTKKAQDGVLEFLLVNHPLDCPVCDKGGECPLQDQTLAYGPGETRFVEEKRHWDKPIPISELVNLDRERCIQCGRCVRFADEVAGDPLIDFYERGDRTEVAVFSDTHPFSSYFSGNIVQICPVGALLAAPYRFRARPWDLQQVETSCTSCSVGCRSALQSSGDDLVRLIGVDNDPVNWSWLCDKGRFDFQSVNSDRRLRAPLVRRGDELVEVSWGEALAAAAEGLGRARRPGPVSQLAVIGGARLPNEDAYAWAKLARVALGTDNVDAQLGDGIDARLLLGLPRATIDQAAAAPLVITLGSDPKDELPILYLRLRSAVRDQGLQLAELTPTLTGLSPYAAVTALHRPGELAALAAALVAEGDPAGDVAGVPEAEVRQLRAHLARARSERPAGAGHDNASEPSVVVVLGRASVVGTDRDLVAAVAELSRIPGVAWLSGLRRANVHGALDLGLAPGVLPGRVGLDEGRAWFEDAWGAELPARAGLDTAGILDAASKGRIGGLVLLGADPLKDFPDERLALRGVEGARFVVAVDTFLTDSARHADVVLPASTWGERRGTFTNLEGRISHLGAIVTPPGVAWADWMIASELGWRLGADLGFSSLEDIWDEITRVSPLHRGVDRALLTGPHGSDGIVVPLPSDGAPLAVPRPLDPMADPGIVSAEIHPVPPTSLAVTTPALLTGAAVSGHAGEGAEGVAGRQLDLPAGAIAGGPAAALPPSGTEGAPADAHAEGAPAGEVAEGAPADAAVEAHGAEPAGAEPCAAEAPARPTPPPMLCGLPAGTTTGAAPAPTGALRLVVRRRLWDGGTKVANSPSLAHLHAAPAAAVHPDELAALGVAADSAITLRSERGVLTLPVAADPSLPRGVVSVPWNLPGAELTGLLDAGTDVPTVRIEAPAHVAAPAATSPGAP